MKLDLRQLRYFVAIGDSGALSYAARTLNVAQSAISHHLADMEAKLGAALVERHSRGVTLTAAGRRLHEHAREILAAVAKAENDIRAFSERMAGPVSLGLSHTATYQIALPLMRAIKSQSPDIMLALVEGMSIPLAERLLAGEIDVALLYNPPQDTRLECCPLLEEDLYLVGLREFLDGRMDDISFGQVLGLPLVMPHPSATTRSLIESFYLRDQLPERIMEFDSLLAINHALAEGIGCSILALSTVQAVLDGERLLARRIIDPEVKRTLYLATLRDHLGTRAEGEIRRILIQVIGQRVSEGAWPARWLHHPVA